MGLGCGMQSEFATRAPQGWACLGSTGVAGLVLELGLRRSGQVLGSYVAGASR